jgi:hypothetical protein
LKGPFITESAPRAAASRARSKKETDMISGRKWLGIVLAGLMALAVPAGLAGAKDVVSGESHSATFPIIDRWPPLGPSMVQAREIKARQVQAHTIYADRIEADDVQGVIYRSLPRDVKTAGKGELETPEVSAKVIYADTIKAKSVVADVIYVRDLPRR